MPLYDYVCHECDAHSEELVYDLPAKKTMPCDCGHNMRKVSVHRFRHIGPVFEDLMAAEERLLGVKGLKAGKRLRGKKDIERWERENGLTACTQQEARISREYALEEAHEQDTIVRSQGADAYHKKKDKDSIKDVTGWTESQYTRWKGATDVEEKRLSNPK